MIREIQCPHSLPISQCPEHWAEFQSMTNNTSSSKKQPEIAQAQGSDELEKQLDTIMEDLIVGHNFDYARAAILQLFAAERTRLLDEVEARVIGEDEDPYTTGRGFKDGHTTSRNKLRAQQCILLQALKNQEEK